MPGFLNTMRLILVFLFSIPLVFAESIPSLEEINSRLFPSETFRRRTVAQIATDISDYFKNAKSFSLDARIQLSQAVYSVVLDHAALTENDEQGGARVPSDRNSQSLRNLAFKIKIYQLNQYLLAEKLEPAQQVIQEVATNPRWTVIDLMRIAGTNRVRPFLENEGTRKRDSIDFLYSLFISREVALRIKTPKPRSEALIKLWNQIHASIVFQPFLIPIGSLSRFWQLWILETLSLITENIFSSRPSILVALTQKLENENRGLTSEEIVHLMAGLAAYEKRGADFKAAQKYYRSIITLLDSAIPGHEAAVRVAKTKIRELQVTDFIEDLQEMRWSNFTSASLVLKHFDRIEEALSIFESAIALREEISGANHEKLMEMRRAFAHLIAEQARTFPLTSDKRKTKLVRALEQIKSSFQIASRVENPNRLEEYKLQTQLLKLGIEIFALPRGIVVSDQLQLQQLLSLLDGRLTAEISTWLPATPVLNLKEWQDQLKDRLRIYAAVFDHFDVVASLFGQMTHFGAEYTSSEWLKSVMAIYPAAKRFVEHIASIRTETNSKFQLFSIQNTDRTDVNQKRRLAQVQETLSQILEQFAFQLKQLGFQNESLQFKALKQHLDDASEFPFGAFNGSCEGALN